MPPEPTSTETLSKTKATLLFLATAMSLLLVHILVKRSSTISLLITANIIILFLVFHYRRNPDQIPQIPHPPLFSFPSLSRPLWYKPLGEYNVELPESVVSLSPGVPRNLEPDMVYDSRSTDGLAWERTEPLERISTEYREEEISSLADDDQGSNMDETWNSIVARGKAKPVRLIPKSQREGNPKSQMKKSSSEKRSEKKKATGSKVTGSTSYDSAERSRAKGSTMNGTGISRDELSHLSEMFIKKRYNDLRIERQESDQRRLAERVRFRDFRNAVSAN